MTSRAQSFQPIDRGIGFMNLTVHVGTRPPDHDDRQLEMASRRNLRVGRIATGVFADDDINCLAAHKRFIRLQRERPSHCDPRRVIRQSAVLDRIDAANHTAVRKSGEAGHALPSDSQEHRFSLRSESLRRCGKVINFNPLIARLTLPWCPRQPQQGHVRNATGSHRICCHGRGERMRSVDNRFEFFLPQELGQRFRATKTACTIGQIRQTRRSSPPGERDQRTKVRPRGKVSGEIHCFARASEHQNWEGVAQ